MNIKNKGKYYTGVIVGLSIIIFLFAFLSIATTLNRFHLSNFTIAGFPYLFFLFLIVGFPCLNFFVILLTFPTLKEILKKTRKSAIYEWMLPFLYFLIILLILLPISVTFLPLKISKEEVNVYFGVLFLTFMINALILSCSACALLLPGRKAFNIFAVTLSLLFGFFLWFMSLGVLSF